jgi:hypothetical protein
MRYFLRDRSSSSHQITRRPARLLLCTAIAVGSLAAVAITGVSLAGGKPASSVRVAPQRHTAFSVIHPLSCGSGSPGPIGTVVRTPGTITRSSLATQGIDFPVAVLARAGGTTLYVAPLGATLSRSHPASTHLGTVTVPSVHPSYRSCNYMLQGNERDQRFKAAAGRAFVAAGLATEARLNAQGIIWMVADDPTSTGDELVAVDIETPMTSTSPGTIRTLVAAVDPSSAAVRGVATAAGW